MKPYGTNCDSLIDSGFEGRCLIITAPSGTIAAIIETQEPTSSSGGQAGTQERDLVYHRVGTTWSLALRRTTTSTSGPETTLWKSDVNRDGDPKAVFVTPAPNGQFGEELDVVEATGQVTLVRQLHGGFATVAASGGLETFLPDSAGYREALIRYTQSSWRVASITQVSQSEAEPNAEGPFDDPEGSSA